MTHNTRGKAPPLGKGRVRVGSSEGDAPFNPPQSPLVKGGSKETGERGSRMAGTSTRCSRTRALLVVIFLVVTTFCGWSLADIKGSKHDFSNQDWAEGESCAACHSPHRETAPKAAPLWNPNADLNRTFGTPVGKKKAVPGSGTIMCVRCHDGTIARDTIAGSLKQRFVNKRKPGMFDTGHGNTDHPVGIRYPQFDRGYRPVTAVIARGTVSLPDGKVECISCHDPHNQAGQEKMLVMSNARSALCLTCHKK